MTDLFDLFAPLPEPGSMMLLEASAGTGKTYTLSFLVARLVAEGCDLRRILAVTFTRRASAELRDGIRSRLIEFRDGYAELLARHAPHQVAGPVGQMIRNYPADQWAEQHSRLVDALTELDAAPILTLHTFAKRILDELGFLADHDPATPLGGELDDLAEEVIRDCYLADYRPASPTPALNWSEAERIGEACLNSASEPLYPCTPGRARYDFARAVRDEFATRMRLRQIMTCDDMVTRLVDALDDPTTGSLAARVLQDRFEVVLIDEFQDTDPHQWRILERAFAHQARLIMIGDPKQAIYRFRGGDVETYLAARADSQIRHLGCNFRSDQGVVEGIGALFGQVSLASGAEPITLSTVQAHHGGSRLSSSLAVHPVQIRALAQAGPLGVAAARSHITNDLINQITVLTNEFTINDRGTPRPVDHADIAVLVHTNKFGQALRDALHEAGYPAVFSGESSVFRSAAARDLLHFLEAVEDLNPRTLRRAALTSLVGWTSADLAADESPAIAALTETLNRCTQAMHQRGVAGVYEELMAGTDSYARLLASPRGEETLTDLRHLVQLLHDEAHRRELTGQSLIDYLRRAIKQNSTTSMQERSRRIPTEGPAIQILTIHQAKGLQFPIVLLPQATLSAPARPPLSNPCIGHVDGRRVLDLGGDPGFPKRQEAYHREELAESLRTFYVAATRAECLLMIWWADVQNRRDRPPRPITPASALHRLVSARGAAGIPQASYPSRGAADIRIAIRESLARQQVSQDRIWVEVLDTSEIPPARCAPLVVDPQDGPLRAASFVDTIDRAWRRTSYSGLASGLDHDLAVLEGFDEPGEDHDAPTVSAGRHTLTTMPGGTDFGSLVHEILEVIDPASPQLADDLLAAATRQIRRHSVRDLAAADLATGLESVLTTPLGDLTGGPSLQDLGAANRLAELDFEMSLGAGHRSSLADLAGLFDTLDGSDPLAAYGRHLADSEAASQLLAGLMVGSIDAVLRRPDGRFSVVDYKTNRIPLPARTSLRPDHYHPRAMAQLMIDSHYPLQALIYSAALHRYLSWRLPGYQPGRHLGPVGYLFIRGMSGPATPCVDGMPTGVFIWSPPAEMIVAASALLGGGP